MEDDHVDRPGVEAQQCVKLTGTNSSIGLIILIACAHRSTMVGEWNSRPQIERAVWVCIYSLFVNSSFSIQNMRLADLVVMAGWLHPFPFRTRP